MQALLALDVEADPVAEVGETVAEAGIDGVLEMGVRVDEAREDDRVGEAPALAELGRRPDRKDPAVLDRHCSVRDGRTADGQHPVRRENHGGNHVSPVGPLLRVTGSAERSWAPAGPSPASPAPGNGVARRVGQASLCSWIGPLHLNRD